MDQSHASQQFDGETPQINDQPDNARSPETDEEPVEEPEAEDDGMSKASFKDLVMKGARYREDYTYNQFGQEVDIQLRPLTSDIYRRLQQQVQEEVDSEVFANVLEAKRNGELSEDMDIEDVDDETMSDLMDMQSGQMGALNLAAKYGIDPDSVDVPEEQIPKLVDRMVGNKAIDIGVEVMALTADVEQAQDFPGSRDR